MEEMEQEIPVGSGSGASVDEGGESRSRTEGLHATVGVTFAATPHAASNAKAEAKALGTTTTCSRNDTSSSRSTRKAMNDEKKDTNDVVGRTHSSSVGTDSDSDGNAEAVQLGHEPSSGIGSGSGSGSGSIRSDGSKKQVAESGISDSDASTDGELRMKEEEHNHMLNTQNDDNAALELGEVIVESSVNEMKQEQSFIANHTAHPHGEEQPEDPNASSSLYPTVPKTSQVDPSLSLEASRNNSTLPPPARNSSHEQLEIAIQSQNTQLRQPQPTNSTTMTAPESSSEISETPTHTPTATPPPQQQQPPPLQPSPASNNNINNANIDPNTSNNIDVDINIDSILQSPQTKDEIVEKSPGGRYLRFSEKLGSGAYKDVYRAYDTSEGIEVAWNVVNLTGVPKTERQYIVNEVRLLEKLNHSNIISFHGSWVNRGLDQVIFVTEILSSGTLKSFINKVQVIRYKIAKRWAIQILKGLEYLHSHDPPIIHRDLKCDNIFINGTSGDLRIGDLGLSTVISNKSQVRL